jgi:osmotically-inducible protein OsmY
MRTNEQQRQLILNEIKWDPQLRSVAFDIGVSVKDRMVILTGNVDSYRRKLAIEKAVKRVSGVITVVSEIEVQLAPEEVQTDAEIETSINELLAMNNAVNGESIQVTVSNGWVFLDGEVDWEFHQKTAEEAVLNVTGVLGVTNRIRLKSLTFQLNKVKEKVDAAFHRSTSIDSSVIPMEVFGSTIMLHSKVSTRAERQEAIIHTLGHLKP